jgi:hypothetical protein
MWKIPSGKRKVGIKFTPSNEVTNLQYSMYAKMKTMMGSKKDKKLDEQNEKSNSES